jgi:hypothetical protein
VTARVASDTGPFAIVPEWVIDAEISHGALRLYAVIGRYTNSDNAAWPSRGTLGARLRTSKDSVDRWVKELVAIGALEVEHRKGLTTDGKVTNRSNVYTLRHTKPGVAVPVRPPSSTNAASPTRTHAAQNENQLEPESGNVLSPEMEEARELCQYLKDVLEIEATVSKAWMVEMERLVRIDGRTPEQVRNCVDWLSGNDFWSMNCRSPQKVRKHWERLRLEAQSEGRTKKGKRAQVFNILDKMEVAT